MTIQCFLSAECKFFCKFLQRKPGLLCAGESTFYKSTWISKHERTPISTNPVLAVLIDFFQIFLKL